MLKSYICVLLISLSAVCYCQDSVTDGTELLLTFFIHRHGDRTPLEASLVYSNNKEALVEASAQYGYGQLTDGGRRRAYQLGQHIRRRYGELLSPAYNKSEIYIRSTDSTRAKMTALSALAATFPALEDNWSSDVNWTPVPYTTVPAKYDFNLATTNCPYLLSGETIDTSAPFPDLSQYTDALNQWSEYLGFTVNQTFINAYSVYDLYTAQLSLGLPLDSEIEDIYPQIEELAGLSLDWLFGNGDTITLQAGVLLNQFFTVADQVIAGEDVQRVQWWSAHDLNVFAFEGVTQITEKQGVPKYASAYALELRKVTETGEYVVVPAYLNTPSEDVITYLEVTGCGTRCAYESFRSITADHTLDEDTWRTKCGFSNDMEFDTSSID